MKRNYLGYSYFSSFILWSDLATKTLEMMLALAQVIGHRTGRMALAGPSPNARDRREFASMGQEKIEAGGRSAQAMAAHMMTMRQPWRTLGFRNLLRSSAASGMVSCSDAPSSWDRAQRKAKRSLVKFCYLAVVGPLRTSQDYLSAHSLCLNRTVACRSNGHRNENYPQAQSEPAYEFDQRIAW